MVRGTGNTTHFILRNTCNCLIRCHQDPNIYLGITGPKFPNYFVINGPTGNWGQGCVLPSVSQGPTLYYQIAKLINMSKLA